MRVVLFSIAATLLLFSCTSKAKRARQYHDKLLLQVQVVIDSSLDFNDAIQSYNKNTAFNVYGNYYDLVNRSRSAIVEAGDFGEDTILKSFSLELLNFYDGTLAREFRPFLNSIKEQQFSEADKQVADSLVAKFSAAENQYWE